MYFTVYSKSLFHLTIPVLTWENRRHSATSPLVSTPNDVWKTSAEIHRYRWHGTTQICVVRRIGGKFSLTNQKYYPDLGMKFLCPFIGPCPHEPGDFFNRISFIRIRVNGALNRSGSGFKTMRFRCPGSLVSWKRKADSCKKVCCFKNVLADSCGISFRYDFVVKPVVVLQNVGCFLWLF